MAPPQPQSSQGQGDNSLAALWLAVLLFALLGVIWYVFHAQIVWFVFKLKYLEACFISIFTSNAVPLARALSRFNAGSVNVDVLIEVTQQTGRYVRYPVILVLAILGSVLFFTHPTARYKKNHSMQTLYDQEKFNWPQVIPVAAINLLKEPIEKGPWSMSLTPMQFAKKNKLIIEEHEKSFRLGAQREKINVILAHSAAYQTFSMQLGQSFNNVDKLAMHIKALFAVFAARANRDQETAKKILDQLAVSAVTGRLDFSGINSAANKYKASAVIKKVLESHAYVLTFMASMLEAARQDGVLAAADFLWLKIIDRPLWYMLNSVGRQTAFSEVGGAFAHWKAEKKLGRKISVPMVEEAVKALDIALKEVIYMPDKEEK